MPQSLRIEELTFCEIRDLIRSGYDTVIVPLGATEQHGPALPLLVDYEYGLQTALLAARLQGNTLVGPVITLGYSIQHTQFAGTISLAKDTLAALIHDVAESHARSGFRVVYFWIAHGEDHPILQMMLQQLESKWPGCFVTGLKDLARYIRETWDKLPLEKQIGLAESGSHAGEFETSMMLAARPELVRMEKAEKGNTAPFSTIVDKMMSEGIQAVSPNGVLGDQRPAKAEYGRFYIDKLAEYLAADLEKERLLARSRGIL
jgi:creatinine amidohydrolase